MPSASTLCQLVIVILTKRKVPPAGAVRAPEFHLQDGCPWVGILCMPNLGPHRCSAPPTPQHTSKQADLKVQGSFLAALNGVIYCKEELAVDSDASGRFLYGAFFCAHLCTERWFLYEVGRGECYPGSDISLARPMVSHTLCHSKLWRWGPEKSYPHQAEKSKG